MFKLSAFGYGLASLLGLGSVVMAILNISVWSTFLTAAIGVWLFSTLIRKR